MVNSEKFWHDFGSQFWEKDHVIVKNISSLSIPQFHEDQIFNLSVRFLDGLWTQKFKTNNVIRIYVNGLREQLNAESNSLLPCAGDGSFSQYHKRCKLNKSVKEYGLVIDGIFRFEPDIWENFCMKLGPFFNHVDISKEKLEVALFIGNYKRSPFGVHVDRSGVFTFPLVGTKKVRTWHPSYVNQNPDLIGSFDYKRHIGESVLLKAKPGEMLYWPSNRWHIGESEEGEFSVTMAVGSWSQVG